MASAGLGGGIEVDLDHGGAAAQGQVREGFRADRRLECREEGCPLLWGDDAVAALVRFAVLLSIERVG